MSYVIKSKLAHKTNYGSYRTDTAIKWIVIHYTANDGDKAFNNANYFQSHANLKASAHYFVDDEFVYISVPANFTAYSVGGSKWNNSGGKYYGKCTNSNSISIELCDTNKNGSIYPTQDTIDNAIALTQSLMSKYGIDADHVIRHYDVNGKTCPAYWVNDAKWEKEFHSKIRLKKTGWYELSNGWVYYDFNGDQARNCWRTINGKDYYFWNNGIMASNEFIKSSDYDLNNKLYYVDDKGAWDHKEYRWMQDSKGWWLTCVGEKWYPKEEWWKIDGQWYYFDEAGYMATGVKEINGKEYTFSKDGVWLS